jgi:hypothetical protein
VDRRGAKFTPGSKDVEDPGVSAAASVEANASNGKSGAIAPGSEDDSGASTAAGVQAHTSLAVWAGLPGPCSPTGAKAPTGTTPHMAPEAAAEDAGVEVAAVLDLIASMVAGPTPK